MLKSFVKAKIHRAKVTDANLNYVGSITIDKELMKVSGIQPFELVHINNLSNAAHWETYAIPGEKGQIVLNGPPSRLFSKDDLVVIFNVVQINSNESCVHRTVFVDNNNSVLNVEENEIHFE